MTECGSYVLFYENFIAYRAVLTLGKSRFGAGRSLCGIDNLYVSLCGNSLGICMRRVALTRKRFNTLVRTCRIRCDFALVPVVSECGHFILFYKNFITNRAMFALCKSRFGTGRSLCGIDSFNVTLCGNFSLFNYRTAYRTFDMLIALVYTVGLFVNNPIGLSMSLSGNSLGICMRRVAFARKRFNALVRTRRIHCNFALVPVMTKRGNFILFYKNFIAYRAVFALGKSGFCTCCGLCGVNNFGMSLCRNHFGIGM